MNHLTSSHSHETSDHPHQHNHDVHPHDYPHEHGDGRGNFWNEVGHLITPHSHSHHTAALDPALTNERGIWALKVSLGGLLITAIFQVVIVAISGSVALLADTLHNFSDALTAIPLWLAFALARRARNRRYPYGYGRAEDLAGAFIVLMIFASALVVFYESFQKILHPQPLDNLAWVAAAAVIGFMGNELVATFRIRVGREIGSVALVADGLHARVDGFTSLGVLAGVIGVWLGFPWADPLAGLIIGVAILIIVWNTAKEMWRRMMDGIEPDLIERIEHTARNVNGVLDVHDVSARWIGHRQRAELHITVNCKIPTVASHRIGEEVRHILFHEMPALSDITVHIDPCECDEEVQYHFTAHHT
ncbi:MAG: cation diffusion facilitator family transporter [Chloroflexota bacterium]